MKIQLELKSVRIDGLPSGMSPEGRMVKCLLVFSNGQTKLGHFDCDRGDFTLPGWGGEPEKANRVTHYVMLPDNMQDYLKHGRISA